MKILPDKSAHCQWLAHTSQHLHESHHPCELVYLFQCDRIPCDEFIQKLVVVEVNVEAGAMDDAPEVPEEFNNGQSIDRYFVR